MRLTNRSVSFWKDRLPYKFSDAKKYYDLRKAESQFALKVTMNKTTPRSFSVFFILSTIPGFYFMKEMIGGEYSDAEFTSNSNRIYKYFYLSNMVLYGCSLALYQMNFFNPSSKHTLMKYGKRKIVLPLILSLIGLMIP